VEAGAIVGDGDQEKSTDFAQFLVRPVLSLHRQHASTGFVSFREKPHHFTVLGNYP
jgi:hypothetical protein